MKSLLLCFILLLTTEICYGQARDESRPNDPVKDVQFYPNPAFDYLTVQFESPVAKTSKLIFHSIIGSLVEPEQEVINDSEIRVKVKDLPVGYYIMTIDNHVNNTRSVYKFLKK